MSNEVWKSYEENMLTHSAAHYLMTINELLDDHGYARVTDVAKRLNITRGSCSISLKALKKKGLVVEDENRFLSLSDEGQRLAAFVAHNDELLEKFFREVLGVNADQAEIDACKIEHLFSVESFMKLYNFMACFEANTAPVKAFRKELRKYKQACQHDEATCSICDDVCLCQSSK